MSISEQIWWHIAVIARVSLLPAECGRTLPVYVGYRPNHKLAPETFCMGFLRSIEGGKIMPGESALVELTFLVIDPLRGYFHEGFVWDIQEGSLKVGTGEILKIVEAKEVPTATSRRRDQV